jgi:hypothetical protein
MTFLIPPLKVMTTTMMMMKILKVNSQNIAKIAKNSSNQNIHFDLTDFWQPVGTFARSLYLTFSRENVTVN